MPFEIGSVSFRMLELPLAFPRDWADRFAAHRAVALEAVGAGEERGWVTGRHLLDSKITEETARHGGWGGQSRPSVMAWPSWKRCWR